MKIKSREKDVLLEKWRTPIAGVQYLWLSALLQTSSHTHFFFSDGSNLRGRKKRERIHVMTIGRTWPYRLIEEEYARSCIGRYFYPRHTSKGKVPPPIGSSNTWRLWGTRFIKELDEGRALSDYRKKRDKNIFEYLIITQDEWIEFVSGPPSWIIVHDMTVKAAIRRFLKEA